MRTGTERIPYAGATPGTDSNTYPLYTTIVTNAPPGVFQRDGIKRVIVDISHSQTMSLKWYKSQDRGATWIQCGQETITAPSNATTIRDFLVEPYRDWKLDLVNGGTAQVSFTVDIAHTDSRATLT